MTQSVVKEAIFTEILVDRGKNSYFHFKKKPIKMARNGRQGSPTQPQATGRRHRPDDTGMHGNTGAPSPAALKFWELTLYVSLIRDSVKIGKIRISETMLVFR